MSDRVDALASLSENLVELVSQARTGVAAIRHSGLRPLSGLLWRPDVVVTSEQALAKEAEFEVGLWDGSAVPARVAGRDPGTNIAVLKLEREVASGSAAAASAQVGGLVVALGTSEATGLSARLGVINAVGPEWTSMKGGRIEQRILLDLKLARREEGGPVLSASGGWLGMSTLGPRRQVLAIPASTIERIAPVLLKDGHIPRGWIGFALQPVAVPDGLREAARQRSGLMVMSVAADGPAAKAGIVPGDIVLSIDGESVPHFGRVAARLAGEKLGQEVPVFLIRSGAMVTARVIIEERPANE